MLTPLTERVKSKIYYWSWVGDVFFLKKSSRYWNPWIVCFNMLAFFVRKLQALKLHSCKHPSYILYIFLQVGSFSLPVTIQEVPTVTLESNTTLKMEVWWLLTFTPGGGGVLWISSDGDDRRIFWELIFSIPGFFWVGKFGKYIFCMAWFK